MKTIVKRTLTLLLTAALFTSALTGCTDSFSPDQQAAAVNSTAETGAGSEGSAADGSSEAASGADAGADGGCGEYRRPVCEPHEPDAGQPICPAWANLVPGKPGPGCFF